MFSWKERVASRAYHNKHAVKSQEFAKVTPHWEQVDNAQNQSKRRKLEEKESTSTKDTKEDEKQQETGNLLDCVQIMNDGRKLITSESVIYRLHDKWIVKFLSGGVKFMYSLDSYLRGLQTT